MEIIAVIATLLTVYLTIRINIWNWPIGIIGVLAYMILFYQQHLYGEFGLQFIFLGQSIYGWYYWEKKNDEIVRILDMKRFLTHMALLFVVVIVLFIFLPSYANRTVMIYDIITTCLSVLATWYMTIKIINHWIVWIIANMFFILMFIYLEMYWSAGLYLLLMFLNIKGIIAWEKSMKTV